MLGCNWAFLGVLLNRGLTRPQAVRRDGDDQLRVLLDDVLGDCNALIGKVAVHICFEIKNLTINRIHIKPIKYQQLKVGKLSIIYSRSCVGNQGSHMLPLELLMVDGSKHRRWLPQILIPRDG